MSYFASSSVIFLTLVACGSTLVAQQNSVVRGTVVQQQVEAGSFYVYVPRKDVKPTNVLVICHGTIGPNETALKTAKKFIKRWLKFSEGTGVVLVAPAFDIASYASGEVAPGGAAWGYRALDGRTFTSDEFVHAIVDKIKVLDPNHDGTTRKPPTRSKPTGTSSHARSQTAIALIQTLPDQLTIAWPSSSQLPMLADLLLVSND